jgi:hypothetical protein
MKTWFGDKRPQSVLGVSIDGSWLHAVHVRRAKGGVEEAGTCSTALALDFSRNEVALVGQEIRNYLDAAGLRERSCVLSIPSSWVMNALVSLPAVAAEELPGFLQIEAERVFPCPPEQLQMAHSILKVGDASFASLTAVRKDQLERLGQVARAAGLRPVSYKVGSVAVSPSLAGGSEPSDALSLQLDRRGVVLVAMVEGSVAALRSVEAVLEAENGERVFNAPAVSRELRITLEQVPPLLQRRLATLVLAGEPAMVGPLAQVLASWASSSGVALRECPLAGAALQGAVAKSIAVELIEGGAGSLEFLPPKPGALERLLTRYGSKRLTTAVAASAAVCLVVLGVFGWHFFKGWSLEREWEGMKAQAASLEKTQASIREFRPWYDTSFRSLTILKRLSEVFPENGTVTAKTFEIRGGNNVTVTGTTRDNAALLRTHAQLRKLPEVSDLKVEQIRGKSPAQFTITFRWNTGAGA